MLSMASSRLIAGTPSDYSQVKLPKTGVLFVRLDFGGGRVSPSQHCLKNDQNVILGEVVIHSLQQSTTGGIDSGRRVAG